MSAAVHPPPSVRTDDHLFPEISPRDSSRTNLVTDSTTTQQHQHETVHFPQLSPTTQTQAPSQFTPHPPSSTNQHSHQHPSPPHSSSSSGAQHLDDTDEEIARLYSRPSSPTHRVVTDSTLTDDSSSRQITFSILRSSAAHSQLRVAKTAEKLLSDTQSLALHELYSRKSKERKRKAAATTTSQLAHAHQDATPAAQHYSQSSTAHPLQQPASATLLATGRLESYITLLRLYSALQLPRFQVLLGRAQTEFPVDFDWKQFSRELLSQQTTHTVPTLPAVQTLQQQQQQQQQQQSQVASTSSATKRYIINDKSGTTVDSHHPSPPNASANSSPTSTTSSSNANSSLPTATAHPICVTSASVSAERLRILRQSVRNEARERQRSNSPTRQSTHTTNQSASTKQRRPSALQPLQESNGATTTTTTANKSGNTPTEGHASGKDNHTGKKKTTHEAPHTTEDKKQTYLLSPLHPTSKHTSTTKSTTSTATTHHLVEPSVSRGSNQLHETQSPPITSSPNRRRALSSASPNNLHATPSPPALKLTDTAISPNKSAAVFKQQRNQRLQAKNKLSAHTSPSTSQPEGDHQPMAQSATNPAQHSSRKQSPHIGAIHPTERSTPSQQKSRQQVHTSNVHQEEKVKIQEETKTADEIPSPSLVTSTTNSSTQKIGDEISEDLSNVTHPQSEPIVSTQDASSSDSNPSKTIIPTTTSTNDDNIATQPVRSSDAKEALDDDYSFDDDFDASVETAPDSAIGKPSTASADVASTSILPKTTDDQASAQSNLNPIPAAQSIASISSNPEPHTVNDESTAPETQNSTQSEPLSSSSSNSLANSTDPTSIDQSQVTRPNHETEAQPELSPDHTYDDYYKSQGYDHKTHHLYHYQSDMTSYDYPATDVIPPGDNTVEASTSIDASESTPAVTEHTAHIDSPSVHHHQPSESTVHHHHQNDPAVEVSRDEIQQIAQHVVLTAIEAAVSRALSILEKHDPHGAHESL